jgi:hypothetical protein
MASTYKLNQDGIAFILNNPNGPVGKDLKRRGRNVKNAAQRFVGVDTGLLRASITMQMSYDVRGLKVRVGSKVPYALMHHNGTRPHQITASPGKLLRFPSRGRIVMIDRVNHPGTRPNPFLLKALAAAKV